MFSNRVVLLTGGPVAIAEAAQNPTMRSVPIKTDEQFDLQTLHRAPLLPMDARLPKTRE